MRRSAGLIPRLVERQRRGILRNSSAGYDRAVEFITAIGFYGGIGYLLDRWLGTWPVIFIVGIAVGNLTGIYIMHRHSVVAHDQLGDEYKALGVTRTWPKQ